MAFHFSPRTLGACFIALSLAATALAAERPNNLRKPQHAVAVPTFDFTGRMASPLVEVPAFVFTGRTPDPVASVPAFTFTGRMSDPVVNVDAFTFTGNGGDIVVATPPLQLSVRPLPTTISTGALRMTGRRVDSQSIATPPLQLSVRPLPTTINTGALGMIGRRVESRSIDTPALQLNVRPLPTMINTGALSMTGRGVESRSIATPALQLRVRPLPTTISTGALTMTGRRSAGAAAAIDNSAVNAALQVQPPQPRFRLLRVTPIGAGGTNPFDYRDVRSDVAVALAGGSVAPTPGGNGGSVTPPAPVAPTALTLAGALPAFEVKAGTPAHIQIDTAAQTLSLLYNGAPQAATPNTALSLDINLISFGNVTASLNAAATWSVVVRDYPQPFDASRTACTVLRHGDGTHYKILLGVTKSNTGFAINTLSGTHHDTTAPSCP